MTTTIQKWGNSHGIRIPKILLDTVKWDENEQIIILVDNGKLVIEKAKERKNIKELFADFKGEYEPVEIDWGESIGDEIW
ncbi:MAG: AbrB/MazE/SpoVT family DNA-binding domain-containing protein [Clostridia bacterium]|nr:AbrB/MazE/SpoVT family DNA-binding domain-containing protein [Clostridia bacterium]